jgi:hypothetical protein
MAIVGLVIAAATLKDTLAHQLLGAMVDIARVASVIARLDHTAQDPDGGLRLAKQPYATVAAQEAPVAIRLQGVTAKPCKRQHDLRILRHGGFLSVVA